MVSYVLRDPHFITPRATCHLPRRPCVARLVATCQSLIGRSTSQTSSKTVTTFPTPIKITGLDIRINQNVPLPTPFANSMMSSYEYMCVCVYLVTKGCPLQRLRKGTSKVRSISFDPRNVYSLCTSRVKGSWPNLNKNMHGLCSCASIDDQFYQESRRLEVHSQYFENNFSLALSLPILAKFNSLECFWNMLFCSRSARALCDLG